MTARRNYSPPPTWDNATLERLRREAVERFIAQRAAEGGQRYRDRLSENIASVERLFIATNDLLDFTDGSALATNPSLIEVARYLGGPPISADDLDTLAEARIATRKRLDQTLAQKAANVIEVALDRERFPWLFESARRAPTAAERTMAIRWTAGLTTVQQVQTQRRTEAARLQQQTVERLLERLGFTRVSSRPIEITGGLAPGEFCREALVAGIKCDIPIGLHDGRFLFVECKVSNSATNSVKRLNREVGGKAAQWRRSFGERAITSAVLAGVYKLKNLLDAQETGVAIFWEHDLDPLAAFLQAAV